MELDGYFDINDNLFKEDDGSDRDIEKVIEIFTVNGIAILYPYMRSIVSMVSGLDDSNRIILPTINLRNFEKEE